MVWSVTRAIRASTQASWHCRRTGSPTVSRTPSPLQAVSPTGDMSPVSRLIIRAHCLRLLAVRSAWTSIPPLSMDIDKYLLEYIVLILVHHLYSGHRRAEG